MTRNQRSYHAFIRTIKAVKGITHKQAIGTARALKERLGRTVRAVDIKRHPKLTGKAIAKAKRHGKKTVPPKRGGKRGGTGGGTGGGYDYGEDYDYDYEEYVWTFDTGEDT